MSVAYYHGGPRGLKVGLYILPPDETGKPNCSTFIPNNTVHDGSKVYVTTSYQAAEMYAAFHHRGSVYAVDPEGVLVNDSDCDQPGLSYACDRARIIASLPLSPSEARAIRIAFVEAI